MIASYPDDTYEKEIDRLINFYRGRLYLKDSEYKILSDIADDAERVLAYLKSEKETLIDGFKQTGIDKSPSGIRGFALFNARYSNWGSG